MKKILLLGLSLLIAMVVFIGLYGATQTGDVIFTIAGILGMVAWMYIALRTLMHLDNYEHKNIL